MTVREFFIKSWNTEEPKFGKVLRALPDQLSYRPHERSPSAGELAWQLAEEQRVLNEMLDDGAVRWAMKRRPHPASMSEIIDAWDQQTAALRTKIDALDDAKWNGAVTFFIAGTAGGRGTAGLFRPADGHVTLGDDDITTLPMYLRAQRGISYLPQEASVFRKLTVQENLLAVFETMNLPLAERQRGTAEPPAE